MFLNPINLVENPKINVWLTMVEQQMRLTLATLLAKSVKEIQAFSADNIDPKIYVEWVDRYQAQLVVLSTQIVWSEMLENSLTAYSNGKKDAVKESLKIIEATLNVLADSVLQEQPPVRRKKLEHLVSNGLFGFIFLIIMLNLMELSPFHLFIICQISICNILYEPMI